MYATSRLMNSRLFPKPLSTVGEGDHPGLRQETAPSSSFEVTDRELVARCQNGDVSAFNLVYERYAPAIFRFCYRLVGSAEDADDLKQETFVRAWRAIGTYRGEGALATWLMGIAANLASDHRRRMQARATVMLPENDADVASREHDPMEILLQGDTVRQVHQALAELPEGHRTILVLRDLEDMAYRDIAQIMKCSLPSVKLRLFRARRALKRKLEASDISYRSGGEEGSKEGEAGE